MIVNSSALELEANCQLDLTLSEESAVSSSDYTERRIRDQALCEASRTTRRREVVQRAVYTGDLGSIEQVKGFR